MATDGPTSLTPADMALLTYDEAAAAAGVEISTIWQWVSRYGLTQVPAEGRGARDGVRFLLIEREVLDCEAARRRSPRGRPRRSRPSEERP